jgi:hypothetical protein
MFGNGLLKIFEDPIFGALLIGIAFIVTSIFLYHFSCYPIANKKGIYPNESKFVRANRLFSEKRNSKF